MLPLPVSFGMEPHTSHHCVDKTPAIKTSTSKTKHALASSGYPSAALLHDMGNHLKTKHLYICISTCWHSLYIASSTNFLSKICFISLNLIQKQT